MSIAHRIDGTDATRVPDDVLEDARTWYYDLRGENSCGSAPR